MIVGLTGGTGTGKTSISEYFAKNGFEVIDYDKVTREVYTKGSDCLCELVCAFGEDILTSDGELERSPSSVSREINRNRAKYKPHRKSDNPYWYNFWRTQNLYIRRRRDQEPLLKKLLKTLGKCS